MPYYSYSLVAKSGKKFSRQSTIIDMIVLVPHDNQPSNRELIEPVLDRFDNMTIEDVLSHYMIIAIERASDCEGCRYNYFSQSEHMNCDGGCLHDRNKCEICNP